MGAHSSIPGGRFSVPVMVVVSVALALAGCRGTKKQVVPKVAAVSAIEIQVPRRDQASFALAKVVSGIRRGTAVAHFPRRSIMRGSRCNFSHPQNSTLDWAAGTRQFGNWRSEFGDVFFDVLRDKGVNVVGDPQHLFKQDEAALSAEYLIGARIRELKGNFCEAHNWWNNRAQGRYKGEFYIRIEWSVFSTLSDRTVARFETNGHFKLRKYKRSGISMALLGAFSAATENLLAEKQFIGLLERRPAVRETSVALSNAAVSGATGPDVLSVIEIPRTKLSKLAIRRIVGDVTAAVVSVRVGGGHGSGFIIGESGLLLTNAHVVRQAGRVQVVFANGLEISGDVLRRDPVRDVALVKIPIRARNVLPIRATPARTLEDVYAVGSPMMEALEATVTRGIVSAWRKDERTGLRHIQADVPVSGGNSGGPLLDGFGNVIGITRASYVHERAQNLNLFIPIEDALDVLKIKFKDTRSGT